MTYRVLYISYDGMTDPLGQSQVIPYLEGLAARGYNITLISAEKNDRLRSYGTFIGEKLVRAGIEWVPVSYTKRPPVLSTILDIVKITRLAVRLHKLDSFQIVHCRSYISAFAGIHLKRRFGVKFLFDMRGFWADERVDGGIWNLKNPLFRIIYRYFKHKEAVFLRKADYVVSLTHAAKAELANWKPRVGQLPGIEVIPCCADLDHFSYHTVSAEMKNRFMKELSLKETDFIITYLGSLGTWYMTDEMLRFFKFLLYINPESKFLVITHDDPEPFMQKALELGIPQQRIRIRPAAYHEVPVLISLGQFSLFFIKPAYSKKASSPTKLAEILGMGVPVVCNAGVGDVDSVVKELCPVCVACGFSDEELMRLASHVTNHPPFDQEKLREVSKRHFSLVGGIEKYFQIYARLLQ